MSAENSSTVTAVGATPTLGTVSSAGLALQAPYALTGGTCTSSQVLTATQSCTLIVTFMPLADGVAMDSIVLGFHNGASDTSASRALTGTGTTPVPPVSPSAPAPSAAEDVLQAVSGAEHTCELLTDGGVRCFGNGSLGRLGYGNEDDVDAASAELLALGEPSMQLAAGDAHTCALLESGAVRCWGAGEGNRLGYGHDDNVGDDETPDSVKAIAFDLPATQIAAGATRSCALLTDGTVRCWGSEAP
jgi:alpha-tubulin suppressor-like RCC1 family protein